MVLDPIRPNETSAAAAAVAARTTSPSSHPESSAPVAAKPVSVQAPEPHEQVNVKWDRSDGVIVTFTDKKSGDLVRQIPSEQVLNVARFIRQLLEQIETGSSPSLIAGSGDSP